MRNAGASIDPPTDPFEAIPKSSRPVPPGARGPNGVKPQGGSRLPPGVSPDIFGSSGFGSPAGPAGGTDRPAARGPAAAALADARPTRARPSAALPP